MPPRHGFVARARLALTACAMFAACRASSAGLAARGDAAPVASSEAAPRDGATDLGALEHGAPDEFGPSSEEVGTDGAPRLSPELPRASAGPPGELGCADGTREGFLDRGRFAAVAGCAGGFRVGGLAAGPSAQCAGVAGNSGDNPTGVGCSAANLCARGWHVCADAGELAARAPAGCDGSVPAGYTLFFLVRAGASPDGVCGPMLDLRNDVHGCGSFGEPAHPSCAPVDRRLSFAGCQATGGVWSCGGARDHLSETTEVSKTTAALGGALCCRTD